MRDGQLSSDGRFEVGHINAAFKCDSDCLHEDASPRKWSSGWVRKLGPDPWSSGALDPRDDLPRWKDPRAIIFRGPDLHNART